MSNSFAKGHLGSMPPSKKLTAEELRNHDGPLAFLIPGNHDYFDSLQCYNELIVHGSWLGGWYMPQNHGYFIV